MTETDLLQLLATRDRELFDAARNLVVATHARDAVLARLEGVQEELRQSRDQAQALMLQAELARRDARRFYRADGSFEVLASAEEVVERRKAAAVLIDALATCLRRALGKNDQRAHADLCAVVSDLPGDCWMCAAHKLLGLPEVAK